MEFNLLLQKQSSRFLILWACIVRLGLTLFYLLFGLHILLDVSKENFDVVVHGDFVVAASVISDENGNIIIAVTQKLTYSDALIGEASATLLTSQVTASSGCGNLFLEGDALLVILAINNPLLFLFLVFC
jgi:hypothetical protein